MVVFTCTLGYCVHGSIYMYIRVLCTWQYLHVHLYVYITECKLRYTNIEYLNRWLLYCIRYVYVQGQVYLAALHYILFHPLRNLFCLVYSKSDYILLVNRNISANPRNKGYKTGVKRNRKQSYNGKEPELGNIIILQLWFEIRNIYNCLSSFCLGNWKQRKKDSLGIGEKVFRKLKLMYLWLSIRYMFDFFQETGLRSKFSCETGALMWVETGSKCCKEKGIGLKTEIKEVRKQKQRWFGNRSKCRQETEIKLI